MISAGVEFRLPIAVLQMSICEIAVYIIIVFQTIIFFNSLLKGITNEAIFTSLYTLPCYHIINNK